MRLQPQTASVPKRKTKIPNGAIKYHREVGNDDSVAVDLVLGVDSAGSSVVVGVVVAVVVGVVVLLVIVNVVLLTVRVVVVVGVVGIVDALLVTVVD